MSAPFVEPVKLVAGASTLLAVVAVTGLVAVELAVLAADEATPAVVSYTLPMKIGHLGRTNEGPKIHTCIASCCACCW